MKKYILSIYMILFFGFFCHSQSKSAFESGLFYFRANKPADAVEMFTKALEDEDVNPGVYVYLGVSYFQLGLYEDSLDACVRGLAGNGTEKKILAFNAGNACFALKDFSGAEEYYRRSISFDSTYIPPVLNLGNTLVEQIKYNEAVAVYEKFLELAGDDPQCDNVREIIEKLKAELEKNKDLTPVLISLDDVEYLNRKDAEEEAFRKKSVPLESIGEEYFLKSGENGLYIVKSERIEDGLPVFQSFSKENPKVEWEKFNEAAALDVKSGVFRVKSEKFVELDVFKNWDEISSEKADELPPPEKVSVEEYFTLTLEDDKIIIEDDNGVVREELFRESTGDGKIKFKVDNGKVQSESVREHISDKAIKYKIDNEEGLIKDIKDNISDKVIQFKIEDGKLNISGEKIEDIFNGRLQVEKGKFKVSDESGNSEIEMTIDENGIEIIQ